MKLVFIAHEIAEMSCILIYFERYPTIMAKNWIFTDKYGYNELNYKKTTT
jgi:hypothetical protein